METETDVTVSTPKCNTWCNVHVIVHIEYGHIHFMVWTQHTCNGRYGKEMETLYVNI